MTEKPLFWALLFLPSFLIFLGCLFACFSRINDNPLARNKHLPAFWLLTAIILMALSFTGRYAFFGYEPNGTITLRERRFYLAITMISGLIAYFTGHMLYLINNPSDLIQ